ncbi:MAG: site-2 protease family protein [Deltaproteobacteria bacterium]|nr:site-2 protease family protein [Deltaproteobacteria bacterium]MCK4603854.1 site-2 protease family protein [Deltaproteobacteria bacterium]
MDFAAIIQRFAILTPPILLAVTVHEMAHGWVAYRLGDPTAKLMGRLTLNPIRHLDPIGTMVFFLTQTIGWAKPVPVNPSYFKNPRNDMVWVALAGPGANILLAILSAVLLRQVLGPFWETSGFFVRPVLYMAYVSVQISVQINIGLAVFNLLPIPPLDGSKVLMGILPPDLAISFERFERYGFLLILVLVFTGVAGRFIIPVILYLNKLLLGTVH